MGLDQYLYARKYVSNWSFDEPRKKQEWHNVLEAISLEVSDVDIDNRAIYVSVPVAYWRKANQIHSWFVDNIQGGEDDCDEHYITRENMKDLLTLCEKVMEDKTEAIAAELLPVKAGFFYGNYEYDKWYYEQVEYTASILKKILDNAKLIEYDFYYDSSW